MGRPGHCSVVAVLLFFLVFPVAAGDPEMNDISPDLSITGFNVTRSVDGYTVSISVTNSGRFPSEQVWSVIFDENDIRTGSGVQIARVSVPSLDPGQEFSRSVDWFPGSGMAHRLRAIVDVENRAMDRNRLNNVATLHIELPGPSYISSPLDGDPDPLSIGWAFSGVGGHFPIEIGYSGDPDPGMVKAYIQVGDGAKEYVPTGPSGVSMTSLDMGLLDPGVHELRSDVTISGVRHIENGTFISVREVPDWISSLGSYRAAFDRARGEYVFTGVMDIPSHSTVVPIEGINRSVPVELCGSASDVYLEVRVLTDGTTTVSARGSIAVSLGSEVRTIAMNGRSFAPDPADGFDLSMSGEAELLLSLIDAQGAGYFEEALPGASFPLLDPPDIRGIARSSVEIKARSGMLTVGAVVSLDMEGNGVQVLSERSWGLDSPYAVMDVGITWNTTHTLDHAGRWQMKGGSVGKTSLYVWDLGIASGILPPGSVAGSARGLSILDMIDGNASAVSIPQGSSSMTYVTYTEGDKEIRLHGSNLYKSSPCGMRLSEDELLIAWTEATSYSSDVRERYSSLRVMYGILDTIGGVFQGPFQASAGTSFSPGLVSFGPSRGVSILHIIDNDGDPGTMDDRTLTMAFMNGSAIEGRLNITHGNISRVHANARTADGGVIIGWIEGSGIGSARIADDGSITRIDPIFPGGDPVSLGMAPLEDGSVALCYSTIGKGGSLGSVEAMRIGPDGIAISGPAVIRNSDAIPDSISMRTDGSGHPSLSWRESRLGSDSIYVSMAATVNGGLDWLPPLKIASDHGLKFSPDHIPIDDGMYVLGWLEPLSPPGKSNGSEQGDPILSTVDLSHAADVLSASHSLKGSYLPGDMVVVSAEFENRGFSHDTVVMVDFIKAIRDPLSGEVTGQNIGTRTASFDDLRGRTSIEFPMLVSENQLGVHVVVVSPRWAGPDHESSMFVSMPAISDPVLKEVSFKEGADGLLNVEVKVRNQGSLPTGTRHLSVVGTQRTLPMSLPGKMFEPALLREGADLFTLNSTAIHMGPFEERTYLFDVVTGPGIGDFRVRLDGQSWEKGMLSDAVHRHAVLPDIRVRLEEGTGMIHTPTTEGLAIILTNEGGCSVLDMGQLGPYSDPSGTIPVAPSRFVEMRYGGSVLFSVDISNLSGGQALIFDMSDDLRGRIVPGENISLDPVWDQHIRLMTGKGWMDAGFRVHLLEKSTIRPHERPRIDTVLRTHKFALGINNTSNHTIGCLVLNLHNGLPNEGDVIASVVLYGIAPGEMRNASLRLNIGEGVYFLHLEALEQNMTGPASWDALLIISGEFVVMDERAPADNEDKATQEEIQRALIIAGLFAVVVLVGALINRAYEESRKDRD